MTDEERAAAIANLERLQATGATQISAGDLSVSIDPDAIADALRALRLEDDDEAARRPVAQQIKLTG